MRKEYAMGTRKEDGSLNYGDYQDFYDSAKGFLSELDESITGFCSVIWNTKGYDKLLGNPIRFTGDAGKVTKEQCKELAGEVAGRLDKCPEGIHKSLWRQALLNHMHGLYEVCPGVYQGRGYDLANMTIVETDHGVVVIDCTTVSETAKEILALYQKYRNDGEPVNVIAVILTHTHVDHYGGIKGVTGGEGSTGVIAPDGFLEAAALENAIAGDAMARRSTYQYGTLLEIQKLAENGKDGGELDCKVRDGYGKVDAGLGKDIQRGGSVTFAVPGASVVSNTEGTGKAVWTQDTKAVPEQAMVEIDGKTFEFLLFPGTEAPAEMTVWLEDYKVLVAAEIATHTLHNTLTPRGAEVRDARLWWKSLDQLLMRYGSRMDCICATHHWPVWRFDMDGNSTNRCETYLSQQRDTYKFLHDQTVRLMNQGYTMLEIAAWFENEENLPDFLKEQWHNRGYYGTISHDVRAIYQKYLGWYDMNPSNLNPLPAQEAAQRYIELIGEDKAYEVLKKALEKKASDHPEEYRWAAEVGKHLVFSSDLKNSALYRGSLADIYECLGALCEAGTWRNMYLAGARELREGKPLGKPEGATTANSDILMAMDEELFYDYLSIRWNAGKAMKNSCLAGKVFHITLTGSSETLLEPMEVTVDGGVLNYHPSKKINSAAVKFELAKEDFIQFITGKKTLDEMKKLITLEGEEEEDMAVILKFLEMFDRNAVNFNIVLPKAYEENLK